jgi:Leucine-rich repeat (LRR) protein
MNRLLLKMKKLYTLFFLCLFHNIISAQIINIPDSVFKSYLVNNSVADLNGDGYYSSVVDTNGDGEIQVTEAEAVIGLRVSALYQGLVSVQGIESFVNLKTLLLNNNEITSIDVSALLQLEILEVEYNQLTNLDVTQNPALKVLKIQQNNIGGIDVTQNPNLEIFESTLNPLGNTDFTQNPNLRGLTVSSANMTSLDISQNVNLEWLGCGGNQLTSIDLSQNVNLKDVYLSYNQLTSIDVSMLPNLETLQCGRNLISAIDVTQNPNLIDLSYAGTDSPTGGLTTIDLSQNSLLKELYLVDNNLTSINLSQNPLLEDLSLSSNQLTTLDISQNPLVELLSLNSNQITTLDVSHQNSIGFLDCRSNLLTELDVSMHTELAYLNCNFNQLTSLNIKNGPLNISTLSFAGNPDLAYLCADEQDFDILQTNYLDVYGYTDCVMNSYCSFDQAGDTVLLSGSVILDADMDGCDINDSLLGNLRIQIGSLTNVGVFTTNADGTYSIPVLQSYTYVTPQLENPSYYTVTPSTATINLSSATSPYTQDFCIVPNGVHNDLEVIVVPVDPARPGFDTDYKIVYKNKGNTILSGSITLQFDDDYMDFSSAIPAQNTQSVGQLTWSYSNISPQEVREIDFTMTLNAPTDTSFPLNQDDVLNFTGTIDPQTGDDMPLDNVMTLSQTVVNSFDPNDKLCLEGDTITPDKVGEYVHYMIRFENTGTASAINVVVKDDIDDTYYDINTLQPLSASHPFVTKIQGQKVEFIFENINLPFDDATNDGYVLFKIRTKNTLMINDIFANKADIYFDFNAPIITELAETLIAEPLSVLEVPEDQSIVVYPIPAKDVVHIEGDNVLTKASLYDVNGLLLIDRIIKNNKRKTSISVQSLANGLYILKVQSEKGNYVTKIIK